MQRHFYALPDDLIAIFDVIEAQERLRYTATDTIEASLAKTFSRGASLPTLRSPPPGDSAISGHSYLMTLCDTEVVGRRIALTNGDIRYAFDQLINPDSIEFLPGAQHPSGAILYGRIATCTDSPTSKKLFSLVKRAIGKHFRKINAFWVGPKAEAAWRQGARLTIGLSSPREYDLREVDTNAV